MNKSKNKFVSEFLLNVVLGHQCFLLLSVEQRYDPHFMWESSHPLMFVQRDHLARSSYHLDLKSLKSLSKPNQIV